MRQAVIVRAQMADGSVIEATAATFAVFTALVLAFRADAECVRLTWKEAATASDDRAQAA